MPGRPTSVDGLSKAVMAANPHLDAGRDDRAVHRLAWCYKLTDDLQKRLKANRPGAKDMDEYHKLYADALRLEQELGITPAARRRHGLDGDPPTGDGLGGAKA